MLNTSRIGRLMQIWERQDQIKEDREKKLQQIQSRETQKIKKRDKILNEIKKDRFDINTARNHKISIIHRNIASTN